MPADRAMEIASFLEWIGWCGARRAPLAGDASARRYERLTHGPGGGRAVLMDAPPDSCPTTPAFVAIARHLQSLGFSAPRILEADVARGLLLLEDLGDGLFARVAKDDPASEMPLYMAATDLLIALHKSTPPATLAGLSNTDLAYMIGVTYDWYRPTPDPTRKREAMDAMRAALAAIAPYTPVLALRDFHAENLLWLPERSGIARIGLLDFQDAFTGHPAFDLVSLTRDARRNVSAKVTQQITDHYIATTGQDPRTFTHAAATLAVQRNLRILGVFARLALRDAKPAYIPMIPRVWGHLMADLAHPALRALREILTRDLPAPDHSFLHRLRNMRA